MPNIQFHLNPSKKDKKGFVPVRAKISVGNKSRFKTVGKVKKEDWSDSKRMVKTGAEKVKEHNRIVNQTISQLKRNADEFFSYCTSNNINITIEMVEDFFAGKSPGKRLSKISFNEAFEEYIESGRPVWGKNTIRNYITAKNYVFEFQENTGINITFESINLKFWDHFVKYSYELRSNFLEPESKVKYKKVLVPNTLAKYRNVLISFLNWATEREYYDGNDHLKFKAPEHDIDIIYLTEEELDRLYLHKFDNKTLERVRDVFVFGCYTGLRYSDLMDLNSDHINNGLIRKAAIKTSRIIEVPVLPMAQEIIDKYDDSFRTLPQYTDVNLNKYIKVCCKEAGINQPFTITTRPGNKRKDVTKPKYNFVVVHTARKTFINLAHKYNMPESLIMDIVGQSEYRTFMKYRKYEPEKKKEDMNNTFKDYVDRLLTEKEKIEDTALGNVMKEVKEGKNVSRETIENKLKRGLFN